MRRTRLGTGTALLAAVAASGLALTQTAAAVTPQSATITANCGAFGGGPATLTATQSGTSATITLHTSTITTPIALAKDSVTSTATFVNASGGTRVFSGKKNPAMPAGSTITVGPISGTVASGDKLDAYGGSLKLVVLGITITCTAQSPQSPGPFVFD